jgi:5-(carboxyamino)imidazole ribonucleotide synthase
MCDQPSILESFVDFRAEVSVVAARALDGTFEAFDVTANEHRNHILHRSIAPASLAGDVAAEAVAIAHKIAERLEYVGVFAIEFFVVHAEGRDRLFVNEMAPRVHNSGHWTMDGALTSQFEQHIRAVAGWPLGATALKDRGRTWRVLPSLRKEGRAPRPQDGTRQPAAVEEADLVCCAAPRTG